MKYQILNERKQIKKMAHQMVRTHYLLLAFLAVLMVLFGKEFQLSRTGLGYKDQIEEETVPAPAGEEADEDEELLEVPNASTVLEMILKGQMEEGASTAKDISDSLRETDPEAGTFSRQEGVLAAAVNALASGQLYIRLSQLIYGFTRSDTAVQVIFLAALVLWAVFKSVIIQNAYTVGIRRTYLQARIYEHVEARSIFHAFACHRWIRSCMALLARDLILFLAGFTVILSPFLMMTYWAVPYIVTENPDLSPLQALRLSRRMMKGHKWEVFLFLLTTAGWAILGFLTAGITDMAYGIPYRLSCSCEIYARLRAMAREEGIEGAELLDDRYLFEKADRILLAETYFDVVDELTIALEERRTLKGAARICSEWFGIWIGSLQEKKHHDTAEARLAAASSARESMMGRAYPLRLDPRYRIRHPKRMLGLYSLRDYSVWTLILFFLMASLIGWSWEVTLHYLQTSDLVNRGVLYGPWLPIYGAGGVVVLCLCNRFRKNPLAELFISILLCGVLEYMTSVYLELRYHERWWSYDGYFLNLHGRICAEGLLVFGIGCMIVIYALAPLFDFLVSKIRHGVLKVLCLVLLSLFVTDVVYSGFHPNMAEGAIESTRLPEENRSGIC